MRLTLRKESPLVFNPQDMLEEIELGNWKVKVPVESVLARHGDNPDETMAIFGDHELVLYLLVREVLALRAKVVALESARVGSKPVDFVELVRPQPDEKIGPECFGGSDFTEPL